MTSPTERSRAVIQAKRFLQKLSARTDVPDDVRQEAERLLRHYPGSVHINLAGVAWPMHFATEEVEPERMPSYLELLAHARGEAQLNVAGALAAMNDDEVRELVASATPKRD